MTSCLGVGLCHLREHQFEHSFLDTLNRICVCGFDIETLNHLFLQCPIFTNERQSVLLKIESIISDIFRKTDTSITSIPLYGDPSFSSKLNTNILNSSTDYILSKNNKTTNKNNNSKDNKGNKRFKIFPNNLSKKLIVRQKFS